MLITGHIHSSTMQMRAQPQVCSWDSGPSPCSQDLPRVPAAGWRGYPLMEKRSRHEHEWLLGSAQMRPLAQDGGPCAQVPIPVRRECLPPPKTAFAQWGWKKGFKMDKVVQGDILLTPKVRFPAKTSYFLRLEVRAGENQGSWKGRG